jgi:D-3-phosphoglycerate dehydrogenase/C-terminal binding protein
MGIIGLGRIGGATALRAKGLRMNVQAYDPYVRAGTDKLLGVPLVGLEELLKTSDIVSVHTPLTEETRKLIDASALSLMKPTAILVNTARGAVVDTDALAAALKAGQIAGAGIDVLPDEPATSDMPLIQLWQQDRQPPVNLMITPHTAFYSDAGLVEMREKAALEIRRVLSGEMPKNCVNREFLQ